MNKTGKPIQTFEMMLHTFLSSIYMDNLSIKKGHTKSGGIFLIKYPR
jgi:hypothetical protein